MLVRIVARLDAGRAGFRRPARPPRSQCAYRSSVAVVSFSCWPASLAWSGVDRGLRPVVRGRFRRCDGSRPDWTDIGFH